MLYIAVLCFCLPLGLFCFVLFVYLFICSCIRLFVFLQLELYIFMMSLFLQKFGSLLILQPYFFISTFNLTCISFFGLQSVLIDI